MGSLETAIENVEVLLNDFETFVRHLV